MSAAALVLLLVIVISNLTDAQDTIRARIIWVESDRLYLNAGTLKSVTVGWRLHFAGDESLRLPEYAAVIDRVYPDLSSAPAGPLAGLHPSALLTLPEVLLFPSADSLPHLRHLCVGVVNGGGPLRLPEDIVDYPFLASLFYPWTRSGGLGDLGSLIPMSGPSGVDGRRWKLVLDTACRPGGEYPGGWGALADRLEGIIRRREGFGCPTVWALRPPAESMLGRRGVFFEGLAQVDDTALGFNFATPFHSLPEYVNSGDWRRAVAAFARLEPELTATIPSWTPTENYTWVRRQLPCPQRGFSFVIDTISVIPFARHDDQRLALELGEIDLAVMSVDDGLRLRDDHADLQLVQQPLHALVVFGVNQQQHELADNRLTTAVSYLVDKPALVRALLAERAVVAHTVFGEDHLPGGEPFYAYDPHKGSRLLKDIRMSRPLNFYVDTRIDRGAAIAEHIAAKLAGGGIKTRIRPADRRRFAEAVYRDSMDLFLYAWPVDPGAPDAALYPFLYAPGVGCGTNPLIIDNPELLERLERARQTGDPAARERYYREVEYELLAQPFICPLYRPIMTIAARLPEFEVRLTPAGEIDILSPGTRGQTGKAVR